jgi:UDP-3-O-[3-hydroxymyristoyl] glucosamine N-acyltransferase
MSGPLSLSEVAALVGGAVRGDPDRRVEGVRSLETATAEHLSFLSNRRYLKDAKVSLAGAILVSLGEDLGTRDVIEVADPYQAFARIMQHWHPYTVPAAFIDDLAWVAPDAEVDGARIEAFAWIGPGAKVGPGTWIETGAVVGAGAVIGAKCRLMPKSVVMGGCTLGDRVWLNPGAVVGGEGFGFAPGADGYIKIPQVGGVILGDDVEVGSNSCIDRAALGHTQVRAGAKLDNLVQVGHAADVGPGSLMVAYSGVAGTSRLGRGVVLAAKAAVLGHLELGDGVRVGVASAVTNDVAAGDQVTGVPAIAHRRWLRSATAFASLSEMVKTVHALEKRIEELEKSS